jgi:hypothetical protein
MNSPFLYDLHNHLHYIVYFIGEELVKSNKNFLRDDNETLLAGTKLQKYSFFGRQITKTQKFLRLYSFFDPFKPDKHKPPKITVFSQDFAL